MPKKTVIRGHYCLLIGAMKCATSSLFNILREHPQIHGSDPKEPGFFSFSNVFQKGYDWYESLWSHDDPPELGEGSPIWRLEGSTHYSKLPHIETDLDEIGKLEKVKFIYVVRDPIHRVESQANFDFMRGRFLRRPTFMRPEFLACSQYFMQLKAYIDRFGKDAVLVLNYHDLIADSRKSVGEVLRFLDISDGPEGWQERGRSHSNRTQSITTFYHVGYRYLRYHKYPKFLRWLWLVSGWPLWVFKIRKKLLPDQVRTEVLTALADDIEAFQKEFEWYPFSAETRKAWDAMKASRA